MLSVPDLEKLWAEITRGMVSLSHGVRTTSVIVDLLPKSYSVTLGLMSGTPCPFCNPEPKRILLRSANALALLDGFPVTEGHTLVIPKRHIATIFDLPESEQAELWAEVAKVRALLKKQYSPDAFNIGVNDGEAAGQTIHHAHIHVIPRRKGDVPDPRGGVRWIMSTKAKYW